MLKYYITGGHQIHQRKAVIIGKVIDLPAPRRIVPQPEREVAEILHYWVLEYHVDGFHLKGEQIPAGALAEA